MQAQLTALTILLSASIWLQAEDKVPPPPPKEEVKPAVPSTQSDGKGKAAQGRRHPMLAEFLKKMDSNSDGKISKDEFVAHAKKQADERFSRIDTNKDGFIDKTEAEEAAKKFRDRLGDRPRLRGKGKATTSV